MSTTATQRGRDIVEEYVESRDLANDIDAVVALVRDVLLYIEEEHDYDLIEYVLDSAAEGL